MGIYFSSNGASTSASSGPHSSVRVLVPESVAEGSSAGLVSLAFHE